MTTFIHARSTQELAETVIQSIRRSLKVDEAALYLLDPSLEALTDPVSGRQMDLHGPGFAPWSALHRETLLSNDPTSDPRRSEEENGELATVAAVPIISMGRVAGALEARRLGADGAPLTESEAQALEGMAERVGDGIVAVTLREDLDNFTLHAGEWVIAAVEAHAPGGDGHVWRVAQISTGLATVMGFTESDRRRIWLAAHYHDLGWLLGGPTKGWEVDRYHSLNGARALRSVRMLSDIAGLVEMHHERYDGSGQPMRLKGDAIPLEAYVLGLAEDFDESAAAQGLSHLGEGLPDLPEMIQKSVRAFLDDRRRAHHPRVLAAFEQFADSGQLHVLYT